MGLEIIAEMIAGIGAAAKATAKDLTAAAEAAASYAAASGRDASGGINNKPGNTPLTIATTDLGDPRNAIDTGMRMHAAIEAAKRGR